ncbi:MAG: hypothetical protein AAFX06_21375 [Planctomycetota bacterium]
MANFVYNVGKGRLAEIVRTGGTLGLLLLKAADADAILQDLTSIADILANGNTEEADFTNYGRQTLSALSQLQDQANDKTLVDANDVVFASAGGATNNNLTDAVIFHTPTGVTDDSGRIPILQLDTVVTTDGNNLTIQFASGGFFEAV